jgi:hypothetical protein
MSFQPLTKDQYQKALAAGFTPEQIIENEQKRKAGHESIGDQYRDGKLNAADVVIQGVGQAAGQANDILNSKWSPIGWATHALSETGKIVEKIITPVNQAVSGAIGQGLRSAVGPENADKVGGALNGPTAKGLNEMLHSPRVRGDLEAVGNVAGAFGTIVGAKAALEGSGEVAARTKTAPTPERVVGQITQAGPKDIPVAERGLSAVDTEGVKTYKDLGTRLDQGIKRNLQAVDTALEQSTDTYTPKKLTQRVQVTPGQPVTEGGKLGSNYIKTDYVGKALDDLEELYDKTFDPPAQAKAARLKAKYLSEGLTPKEINDIAREYGTNFGKKAFGKSGEALTSVNATAYENVRSGIKNTVRSIMPDAETQKLDMQTHDMIKTKTLTDKVADQVFKLENKMQKAGLLQKVGRALGKTFDVASGGLARGIARGVTGSSFGADEVMSAVKVQEMLEKNLQLLRRLNAMTPQQAFKELLSPAQTIPKVIVPAANRPK